MLAEIGAGDQPELLVWNKCDRLGSNNEGGQNRGEQNRGGRNEEGQTVRISAAKGEGIDTLLNEIGEQLWSQYLVQELWVPHERGDVMASVYRSGQVLEESVEEKGIRYRVRLDEASVRRLSEFAV